MKVILQRAKNASVKVDGEVIGSIEHGYVALVGFSNTDDETIIDKMIDKILFLRVFSDENDKMNLSVQDVQGSILSISQFTLYASTRKGRRPSFIDAAKADEASRLYDIFNKKLSEKIHVETGKFQADMKVTFTNDGPVTIILDSKELFE